jgi:uncharacterized protein (TIGR00299 family) protein
MKLAYFDCFSGISGDMVLGAMVSLGVPLEWLRAELASLSVAGYSLSSEKVSRHGIQAIQVGVHIEETHHHRTFRTIADLIDKCSLSERVREKSLAIFDRIAAAEASVHGIAKEEVHFHEVGSVDAIVDVVGACLCFEYLGIEKVVASPLPLGGGFVKCRHGTLPVPAPATLQIVKGIPVYAGPVEKEMVTPTGAAIIAEFASSFALLPTMHIDEIGYGAGTRQLDLQPNLLRVIVGRPGESMSHGHLDKLVMVECNIDDMNPEWFGYLMEKLFDDGALDVFWVPIYMKKNRPGIMVQVLCDVDKRDRMAERILSESTTLGVRFREVYRKCLARKVVEIETQWGRVAAKQVVGMDGSPRTIPEFDVCRQIAQEQAIPLRKVYDAILLSAGASGIGD